jgi:leader peptidase (prepilin peptidase) / N-methyltransferase
VPVEWIWVIFTFAFGACIGSFLNVVIYRMPRDKSLVSPGSACPACDTPIRFYDNIPLLSWLLLFGKCRCCRAKISPRYFVVELLTGLLFAGVFVLYFIVGIRRFQIGGAVGIEAFLEGGWLIYLAHIILFAAFIAASAIDLELWVIPLSICWFVTAVGLIISGVSGFVIAPEVIHHWRLFPECSPANAAVTAGAAIGLILSLAALAANIIPVSYELKDGESEDEKKFNHRLEMLKEVIFLLPVLICAAGAFILFSKVESAAGWWTGFSQLPVICGLLGSLWGYFVGCGIVWATRILGTLAFGKEAMGLGDVHLMGAAGAVAGPFCVGVAFFVAPFFGLGWAGYQMFFEKRRQIPYGPFLSMGIFSVMIFHDWFRNFLRVLYL